MVCPICSDQLTTITTIAGTLQQCRGCSGLYIPWDMLAQFSEHPEQFTIALTQMRSMLFPTGRICPHCYGRLSQGHLPNSSTILTLCPTCQLLWTTVGDLEQIDAPMAEALSSQLKTPSTKVERRAAPKVAPLEKDFTSPSRESEFTQRLETLQAQITDLEKKRQEQESLLQSFKERLDNTERQRSTLVDSLAQQEKIRAEQEAQLSELKHRLESAEKNRETFAQKERTLALTHAEEEIQKSRDSLESTLKEKLAAAERVHSFHLETYKKNLEEFEKKVAEKESQIDDLKKQKPFVQAPATENAPLIPEERPIPESSSVKAITYEAKEFAKPSLWEQLKQAAKSAWHPPVTSSPAPKPVPVETPPPLPEPPVTDPSSIEPPREELPSTDPGVEHPQKTPKNWNDLLIGWTPRVSAGVVYLFAGFLDDWSRGFLWAAIVWAITDAVRLRFMYPSKAFPETPVADLDQLPATAWKGVAVTLRGQLEAPPPRSSDPLKFKDASGVCELNRLIMIEILPRVFGLATAGQYPAGELVVKGWARRSQVLFVEVAEARADKTVRKSLVKPLRWATAILVFLFAVLLLFVIE